MDGWVLTSLGVGTNPPRIHGPGILLNTVDKRAARVLLECFLVRIVYTKDEDKIDNTAAILDAWR